MNIMSKMGGTGLNFPQSAVSFRLWWPELHICIKKWWFSTT